MEYDTQYSQELVLLPVFKHQILEEMKYQAPLDFYNKFANIIDEPIADLKDGIKYYEQLSELAEFVFKRNEAVGSVFQLQEAAADLLSENLNQKISEVSELIYILNDNRLPVGLHTEQLTTIIATIVQMSFFQDTNNPENKIVKNREVFNQFTASITEQYEQLQAVEEVNMFAFNKLIKALKNAIYF